MNSKELDTLFKQTKELKKIILIRKTCLSCGAYSEKNMETQQRNFDRLNVPQWEQDIIFRSWKYTSIKSHELLKKLDELIKNEH